MQWQKDAESLPNQALMQIFAQVNLKRSEMAKKELEERHQENITYGGAHTI